MPSRNHALTPVRTLLSAALVAVGVLGGTLTVAPAAPAEAASLSAAVYGGQAFRATNHQRATHDRRRFGHSLCLHRFAARQAERMARQERIFHQDLGPVLRRCHMDFVGENVAVGFPTGDSVVDQGWMKSPEHRDNILEPRFRRMEVVARLGADGRWYASQVFGHHR